MRTQFIYKFVSRTDVVHIPPLPLRAPLPGDRTMQRRQFNSRRVHFCSRIHDDVCFFARDLGFKTRSLEQPIKGLMDGKFASDAFCPDGAQLFRLCVVKAFGTDWGVI